MSRPRTPAEPVQLERQEQFNELCDSCRREGEFAFDTEFVMEDRYETEVCLIQIATQMGVYLIDPFLPLDIRSLWELICDESVKKVVHAGQEDLGLCVQHLGKEPRNVYDVQIAAGLAGMEYPLSLQKLLQAVLHVRLHKSKTLTDWRKRPLTAAQFRYAAEDVAYLLAVRKALDQRLRRMGRLDWAAEEFRGFEDPALYRRIGEHRMLHVKGAGSLQGVQLAIMREVLHWREQLAQARNRPPRTIVRDHLLIEIAKHAPSTHAELRELRGLNLGDRDIAALSRVVKEAAALPMEAWPVQLPRDFETPAETSLIALLTAVLRSYCAAHELAYSLVATKQAIRELIRHLRDPSAPENVPVELLRGWRGQAVGRILADVLAGKSVLRVVPTEGEPTLEIYPFRKE